MRNESACCKTKENRRRRRAISVPSARCWESLEYVSDLCCTRLMASSLMRACTSESTSPLCVCVCVCVFFPHSFWTSSLDVPAGVTQEEGHTGFLIHLLSAVRVLIFLARRIQPFLSLVDREVEFCVLTI